MQKAQFLHRVVLKNYKSIAACDVQLQPLTFLVGANGAGKSNFLDALRFVSDALRTTLDHALRDRGGIKEVRRRSSGHPTHFGIRLEFTLRDGTTGSYAFEVGALPNGGYEVQTEECQVTKGPRGRPEYFQVRRGTVQSSVQAAPAASGDRLYLVNASGLPEFRPVYEAFSRMGFYNLNPESIRDLQPSDPGELLARDGSNIASVLSQMDLHNPTMKKRIEEYLAKVAPGIQGIDVKALGSKDTLEFRQAVKGSDHPWRFLAANMSDGTLRALGILVALLQSPNGNHAWIPLVGIEEPEVALHPGAAGVLRDSLRDASQVRQIVVTSHSPDLLDDESLDSNSILVVIADHGTTKVGPLDQVGRNALHSHLYTAGELLRLSQLEPDPDALQRAASMQLSLLDESSA